MKRFEINEIIFRLKTHLIRLYFLSLTHLGENIKTPPHGYHSCDTKKRKGNKQVEQVYQEMFLLKMTKFINIV